MNGKDLLDKRFLERKQFWDINYAVALGNVAGFLAFLGYKAFSLENLPVLLWAVVVASLTYAARSVRLDELLKQIE